MATKEIILRGITRDGRKFRPSDWAERLYYALAEYGPNRQVRFNPLVKLKVSEGIKCLVVDAGLEEQDPMTFDFLMGFARENELEVLDQDRNPIEV